VARDQVVPAAPRVLRNVLCGLIVFGCCWIEVYVGLGFVWDAVQPGQRNVSGFVVGTAYMIAGPLAVVLATLTAHTSHLDLERKMRRVRRVGLAIGLPAALIGVLVIAAQAVV
jgi:hypothetical protein